MPPPNLKLCNERNVTAMKTVLLAVWLLLAMGSTFAQPAPEVAEAAGTAVRLRQAPQAPFDDGQTVPSTVPYSPGEFERFVQRQAGTEVRRFGAELISGGYDGHGADLSPLVPPDYVVAPGDEVLLTIWGSVDADLRLIIDRAGRITIPRVGPVQVSGVRHMDLQDVIGRRVAQVFKNFQLSVALGHLRGIRVFVTGFVVKPGGYTVNSLSTVVSALMRAGGPAASGSFRLIELRRDGKTVTTFDLYDLLLKGDRSADSVIQAGDVIHVGAVGVQVGIIGSVNRPAVIELKPGEAVEDVLRMAGGFSAVADRTRLVVERLEERNAARVAQLSLPGDRRQTLSHGDVLRAVSAVEVALPSRRQSKRVRIEGEVTRPGDYVMPEGSSILDALRAAGGLTANAFLYATEFTRESVRITQQDNYERAIRDLETELTRSAGKMRVSNTEEAASVSSQNAATARLIDRLRGLRPFGRVVLQLDPSSRDLPDLALEDGDRLFVPMTPSSVGVFGSVFNSASYLFLPGRSLSEYLRLAGGPTKGADEASVFVIRANGNVVSNRQGSSSWFGSSATVEALTAQPGDTIFVPEEMNKSTFVQAAKDWTQILYQLGIGAAGIKSAIR
jgi:protein involved in polysaccharide export with SLBB domain